MSSSDSYRFEYLTINGPQLTARETTLPAIRMNTSAQNISLVHRSIDATQLRLQNVTMAQGAAAPPRSTRRLIASVRV